jgi:hypothetical protein
MFRHGFYSPEAQQGGSIQNRPFLSTPRGALQMGDSIGSDLTIKLQTA